MLRRRPLFGSPPAAVKAPPADPEPEPLLHKFSSTQIGLTGQMADIIRKMGRSIPDADLAPDGRESDPHVTVKYGLHFQTPSTRLRQALKQFGPITLKLGKTSLFRNDDADVVKVDVDSPDLHRLNTLITKLLPTKDTHPTYKPHATIAYVKPGRGKKYEGDTALAGQTVRIDSVLFSGKRGHRERLPLTNGPGFRAR